MMYVSAIHWWRFVAYSTIRLVFHRAFAAEAPKSGRRTEYSTGTLPWVQSRSAGCETKANRTESMAAPHSDHWQAFLWSAVRVLLSFVPNAEEISACIIRGTGVRARVIARANVRRVVKATTAALPAKKFTTSTAP
jgi:hypothetical protein